MSRLHRARRLARYAAVFGLGLPTLTLTGPLTFAAGAAAGTLIANIGNVPAGATPTLTPNDGRQVIAGDATNGWKVVVGLTAASAGSIALAVAAPGANGASVTVVVSAAAITGLISKSDGTLTGWTGNAGTWQADNKPALVSFDRSPIVAQTPAAGGLDAGGDREGFLFKVSDALWYMFYGAGNGSTTDPAGPWRPQYSKSTDKGLTWIKLGYMSMGLTNGSGGTAWKSADMLFFEFREGKYYLHRLTAGDVSSNQICGFPYSSDVWECATVEGTYAYKGMTVVAGTGSDFDNRDAYASCMVFQDGVYHLFYSSVVNGGSEYNVGRSTGTTPYGPFTKVPGSVLQSGPKGQPENPEVYYHPTLKRWVMTTNQVNIGLSKTDRQRAFISKSLTEWTAASWYDFQRTCPMDGVDVVGLMRFVRKADNSPDVDAFGNIPVIYDSDPPAGGNHTGRKLFYTVLEASTSALAYTAGFAKGFTDDFSTETLGQLGGQNGWVDRSGSNAKPAIIAQNGVKLLDMGSAQGASIVTQDGIGNVTDATVNFTGSFATGKGYGVIFSYRTAAGSAGGTNYAADSFFHCDVTTSAATLSYYSGGSDTIIAQVNYGIAADTDHDIQVRLKANVFTIVIDELLRMSFTVTDTNQLNSLYGNGGGLLGLRNGFGGSGNRLVKSFAVSLPNASIAPIYRPQAHDDFIVEFAVKATTLGALPDLYYRLQNAASLANGYRVRLDLSGSGAVASAAFKVVAGAETAMGGATGTRTQIASAKFYHRVRVVVQGGTHTISVDGETQITFTDATFASGVATAFAGGSAGEFDIRSLSMRKGNTVTVNGVTVGQVVTMRGAGGIPLVSATATGTSVALTLAHYPAISIDVAGVERIKPAAGIWGGDVLS